MKVKEVLELINSAHTIRLQYENRYGSEKEYVSTECVDIETSMYGHLTCPIDPTLFERKVKCIFPKDNILYVYLENEES